MGALRAAAACLLAPPLALTLAAPTIAAARETPVWRADVREAAARFGLPEGWILAVITAESGGRTHLNGTPITSPAGAMGLMQLMPATWAELRRRYGLGSDPYDPRDNIIAGTAYLRAMYDRFGYPGLFAAYNAGPERFAEHVASGRSLPPETRTYVARISAMQGVETAPRTSRLEQAAGMEPRPEGLFLIAPRRAALPETAALFTGLPATLDAPSDREGSPDARGEEGALPAAAAAANRVGVPNAQGEQDERGDALPAPRSTLDPLFALLRMERAEGE